MTLDKVKPGPNTDGQGGGPGVCVKDRGPVTGPFSDNRLMRLLSDYVFIPVLGPIFYLWFLTDFLVPEQFRVLRMLLGIPWKAALLLIFAYIAVASISVDFSHGLLVWLGDIVVGIWGPGQLH